MAQANRLLGVDNEEMVKLAPFCYINRSAYDAGYGEAKARSTKGEAVNVPIGNSLTPWREWLPNEHDGWVTTQSWKA